jgi:hypothetical protein
MKLNLGKSVLKRKKQCFDLSMWMESQDCLGIRVSRRIRNQIVGRLGLRLWKQLVNLWVEAAYPGDHQ